MLVDKAEILEAEKKDSVIGLVREALLSGQEIHPGGAKAYSWRWPLTKHDNSSKGY